MTPRISLIIPAHNEAAFLPACLAAAALAAAKIDSSVEIIVVLNRRTDATEEICGFDSRFVSVEDVDFARRLKAHGRRSGRGWGTLFWTPPVTSCRKFDQFGDWYLFRNPAFVRKVFRSDDRQAAEHFW